MKKIVLARIDDRLIHGQVMTQWVRARHFNTIEIVDDAVRADAFLTQVTTMAVPKEFNPLVHSVDEAAAYLLGEPKAEEILLLVKFPATIERLVEKGVELTELNVGGIGIKPGREKIYRNIAVSADEKEIFKRLMQKGMDVFIQMVPTDTAINIEKLI